MSRPVYICRYTCNDPAYKKFKEEISAFRIQLLSLRYLIFTFLGLP